MGQQTIFVSVYHTNIIYKKHIQNIVIAFAIILLNCSEKSFQKLFKYEPDKENTCKCTCILFKCRVEHFRMFFFFFV